MFVGTQKNPLFVYALMRSAQALTDCVESGNQSEIFNENIKLVWSYYMIFHAHNH